MLTAFLSRMASFIPPPNSVPVVTTVTCVHIFSAPLSSKYARAVC